MLRYCMIFTPLSGKDNHGRCVNFGSGLIAQENTESYSWLLSKFVKCMGQPPNIIITDQDRGIKSAVDNVLPDTRHRFCMWHKMMKLGDKVPSSLRDNDSFIHQFTDLVWSDRFGVTKFESKWQEIMTKFDLLGHKWFQSMYEIRFNWIPEYFRDVKMSGLFRTTSLSESENSFFRHFMNKNANLSELYMHFKLAIETQMDEHDSLSLVDQTSTPKMMTKLPFECHAASVYTNSIFLDVQKEIDMGVMFCNILVDSHPSANNTYNMDENDIGTFTVTFDDGNEAMVCSCNFYFRHGLVCRHMFVVMKNLKYTTIPDIYIKHRWMQKACSIFEGVGQNGYASKDTNGGTDPDGVFCVGLQLYRDGCWQ